MAANHSFSLKLDRAEEHLKAFDQEARAWIDSTPYGIVDEPDPEPPPHPLVNPLGLPRRFRITRIDPVPERLSLIIGDCLFNFRAALDHLALSLALMHTPSMTDSQIRGSEFPVIHTGPMDAKTEARKIGCVSLAARAVIKALQPHHRGGLFNTHPLWQIHELNRIDKHRTLTVCIASPTRLGQKAVQFKIPEGGMNVSGFNYVVATKDFEFKVDTVPLRYAPIIRDPNRDVNVQPGIPLEIAFDKSTPLPSQLVIPTVQALCDFVRNTVIAQLSKFL